MWCWKNLPDQIDGLKKDNVAMMSVIMIGLIMAFLLIMIYIASSRWGAINDRENGETQAEGSA